MVDDGNDDNGCSTTFATAGSATVHVAINSKHGSSIITITITTTTTTATTVLKITRNNDAMLSLACVYF